ncbi:hypothetical protein SAMN05421504_102290 [Amycolatopsis xylanica]|uniref:Glycosyl hydrolase n=1 Tax=Amycolatopsis xylanica TaxID=589385 RepID=A0A1H2YW82_9PSEU|nr:glycosyl hydrolase [Amycolatopsis xylanica]SDX09433.1 hypothetical protein SAMN05421504_102290 [Amycolatopsis xylanica]
MDVLLGIGTRKGLFLARSSGGRSGWELSKPHFPMTDVHTLAIDTSGPSPRVLVAVANEHFGPTIASSTDFGESWQEPDHAPVAFPEDTGEAVKGVWQITLGEGVVYAGVEPSALFKSTDGGETFELVRGLWEHEHRANWTPGGGGMMIHTILPHPTNPERVTVAMSTGGVYRTEDGGESWRPSNHGIKADFLPGEFPEYGQCVHKVAMNPANPDRYFLQNHGGVYRSDDDTATWTSIAEGLPGDFGFAMVAHPRKPDVIYNFPLVADVLRFPPDGRCRVYRSEDAGESWTGLGKGLPSEGFYSAVMRDAMCADDADPAGIYFGSRSGEVWMSPDEGESWQLVAEHLPDVFCVRAAVI